jgi:hypothetical protein
MQTIKPMDSSRQMVCSFHAEPILSELNACVSAAKAIETKAQYIMAILFIFSS